MASLLPLAMDSSFLMPGDMRYERMSGRRTSKSSLLTLSTSREGRMFWKAAGEKGEEMGFGEENR